MSKYDLIPSDLTENPTARIAICLVLDISSSMDGDPIEELMEGVTLFQKSLHEDPIAKYAAEVCIIGFGSSVTVIQDFKTVDNNYFVPMLSASGLTPMGQAVSTALDLLEKRKEDFRNVGVDYYQPWMVLMSDGAPTDAYSSSAKRSRSMMEQKKLTVFPIGIGEGANLNILEEFATRSAIRLKGLNFKDFFVWLSKSVSSVSRSTPGQDIKLNTDEIKGWGTL